MAEGVVAGARGGGGDSSGDGGVRGGGEEEGACRAIGIGEGRKRVFIVVR